MQWSCRGFRDGIDGKAAFACLFFRILPNFTADKLGIHDERRRTPQNASRSCEFSTPSTSQQPLRTISLNSPTVSLLPHTPHAILTILQSCIDRVGLSLADLLFTRFTALRPFAISSGDILLSRIDSFSSHPSRIDEHRN